MVTKTKAEKVFKNFQKKYKEYPYANEAVLIENWKYFGWKNGEPVEYSPVPFAIIWEAGPSEWAYRQSSIEVPGIHVEAYTSWALAIYEE